MRRFLIAVTLGSALLVTAACSTNDEPTATATTDAPAASAAPTASAPVVAAGARKTECAAWNDAFDLFIDKATDAGTLILGAGSSAAKKEQGLKDLATAYQAWEKEMAKQAGAATDPELKAALGEYVPLVKKQAGQLAALKDTSFTKVTLEPAANAAQLKVANLCA